jgi:hypothetical protein
VSMAPITFSQDGRTYTFSLTTAALNSVLTTDALNEAYRPNAITQGEAYQRFRGPGTGAPTTMMIVAPPTQSFWADTIAASSPAALSQIPPVQIRAVLAAALAGGGLTAEQPADVAERILRNQNGRDVDLLAAAIVKAAIAAA